MVFAGAGVAVAGAPLVVAGLFGVVVPAPLPVPVPFVGVPPEVPIGVVAGAAGSEVSGVGSGGSGFVRILASISFMPVSDWWRNLYHVLRLVVHSVF